VAPATGTIRQAGGSNDDNSSHLQEQEKDMSDITSDLAQLQEEQSEPTLKSAFAIFTFLHAIVLGPMILYGVLY
jgi:hypothetical protein